MLFFWRLSPRGDGVKERPPSQQPRAPADVADSYGAKRPEPTEPGGGSRRNDYGVRGSSLSRGPRSVYRRPVAPVRPGPEPGSVHHRRPPTAVPRRAAGEPFAWAALAGIRAVRGGVPDQVRLRGRPAAPQRAEDPAHDAGRQPVLHHPGAAEPGRSVPELNTWHSFQYLAVVIVLNRYRQPHGMIGWATVARFAARGWGLYAVGIGLTAACGVTLPRPARPPAPDRRLAGRRDAAALLLLLRLRPVRPAHSLLLDHFLFLRIDGVITRRGRS